MHGRFESIWILFTVGPMIVLSIRANAARHRARRTELAWKLAEKYVL
jgi:hypothetical protein